MPINQPDIIFLFNKIPIKKNVRNRHATLPRKEAAIENPELLLFPGGSLVSFFVFVENILKLELYEFCGIDDCVVCV